MIDKVYEPFADRSEALGKLLDILPSRFLDKKSTVLLAISYGGLVLADEINYRSGVGLDFLFTEPIFAPKNPDCEVAIVSESMDILIIENLVESFGISYDFIYGEAQRKYEEKILPSIYKYRKGEGLRAIAKKNVLIIDDGIDSGLSANIALKTCEKLGANSLIIAAPVIAHDVAEMLEEGADEVYAVYKPRHFVSAKHYYRDFDEVPAARAIEILSKSQKGDSSGN